MTSDQLETLVSLSGTLRPMTVSEKASVGGLDTENLLWVFECMGLRWWLTELEALEVVALLSNRARDYDSKQD